MNEGITPPLAVYYGGCTVTENYSTIYVNRPFAVLEIRPDVVSVRFRPRVIAAVSSIRRGVHLERNDIVSVNSVRVSSWLSYAGIEFQLTEGQPAYFWADPAPVLAIMATLGYSVDSTEKLIRRPF